MKLNYLIRFWAVIAALALIACEKKDPQSDPEEQTPMYEIIEENVFTSEEMLEDFVAKNDLTQADVKEMYDALVTKEEDRKEEMAQEFGSNGLATGYKTYTYKYWSDDEHGNPIRLSARVAWGTVWLPWGSIDLDPDHIYLYEHYTITKNDECPTAHSSSTEIQMLTGDLLLIMPDYIGYGNTRDRIHPYLNYDVTVKNSIDALEAGYQVFQDKHSSKKMEKGWKMYVLGCSQGGGNALAVHKYLDTHEDLAKKWRFDYSYCGSGPYSPALTFKKYLQSQSHSYPVVIPMTLKAMISSYPDIMSGIKEEDFYSAKYLEIKSKIDKLLTEKNKDADEINAVIFKHFGKKSNINIHDMLSEDAKKMDSQITKALFKCLELNDLTTGWTPTRKIKLYHGKSDDIVPYANAQAVKDAFGDKVELFTSYVVTGHVVDCGKFLSTVLLNNW